MSDYCHYVECYLTGPHTHGTISTNIAAICRYNGCYIQGEHTHSETEGNYWCEIATNLEDERDSWRKRAEAAEERLRVSAATAGCIWCGWTTTRDDAEGIADHMIQCTERPEAQRDNAELEAARAVIVQAKEFHECSYTRQSTCDLCCALAAYDAARNDEQK